ncbi:hypothetical protein L6452_10863 [Arctium lappa]|uniref:Uncharacterized protein n=1 Tax=Arctium lappa TaxID=4217 RepID=A0ACB9DMX5_ARCLA|nr:hypothetical protein L6452_10863 [Arctium lappa]
MAPSISFPPPFPLSKSTLSFQPKINTSSLSFISSHLNTLNRRHHHLDLHLILCIVTTIQKDAVFSFKYHHNKVRFP